MIQTVLQEAYKSTMIERSIIYLATSTFGQSKLNVALYPASGI